MEINADFSARAVVHAATLDWVPSPMAGVERRMLDRIGDEVARATSIVRYAPLSHFSPHTHGGGEEFLVLEGVFQDEHGDFPAGSYVRNPPQSRHTPGSEPGCVIFVKLWQFDPDDRTEVKLGPEAIGEDTKVLHQDVRETVRIEHWPANTRITRSSSGGIEILCIEGEFNETGEPFSYQSWLRLPDGHNLEATTGPDGARVWIKEGHLRSIKAPG